MACAASLEPPGKIHIPLAPGFGLGEEGVAVGGCGAASDLSDKAEGTQKLLENSRFPAKGFLELDALSTRLELDCFKADLHLNAHPSIKPEPTSSNDSNIS